MRLHPLSLPLSLFVLVSFPLQSAVFFDAMEIEMVSVTELCRSHCQFSQLRLQCYDYSEYRRVLNDTDIGTAVLTK